MSDGGKTGEGRAFKRLEDVIKGREDVLANVSTVHPGFRGLG